MCACLELSTLDLWAGFRWDVWTPRFSYYFVLEGVPTVRQNMNERKSGTFFVSASSFVHALSLGDTVGSTVLQV